MVNIVILTGAGISAESGLSTFRDGNGLWEGYRISDVCTTDALDRNPSLVCEFYDSLRSVAQKAAPNRAHRALAELEKHWAEHRKGSFLLVTQNVDDLHERAGSSNVVHLHGELNAAFCMECGWRGARHCSLEDDRECVLCGREALRPDVVLFGESPRQLDRIELALQTCNLFISAGTSGLVHPASSFAFRAKEAAAQTILFNNDVDASNPCFDIVIEGKCGVTIPSWVGKVMALRPHPPSI